MNDNSQEAINDRAAARCPFMDKDCDGGGNRHMANINLANFPALHKIYPNRQILHAGVCSIKPNEEVSPWIVCPRRLLTLGEQPIGARQYQRYTEDSTIGLLGYPPGTKIGVWSELRIKYTPPMAEKLEDDETEEDEADLLSLQYRFDYLTMPVGRVSGKYLEAFFKQPANKIKQIFRKGGYEITAEGDDYFVEDCPYGIPNVIEIMTSSTSGGNAAKRTQISQAFEDALLGNAHAAPSINYRQVWARMASQLISKSEIAINWGGRTVWVIQDVLAEYISQTTALDVKKFKADKLNEVNLLCFSYGKDYLQRTGVLDLNKFALYAGVITAGKGGEQTFSDIVKTPVHAPLEFLVGLLAKRKPVNYVIAP